MLRVEGAGSLEQHQQTATALSAGSLLGRLGVTGEVGGGSCCQVLERRDEVHARAGLHEAEHVAAGAASEAMKQLPARGDRERAGALVVQRTASNQ